MERLTCDYVQEGHRKHTTPSPSPEFWTSMSVHVKLNTKANLFLFVTNHIEDFKVSSHSEQAPKGKPTGGRTAYSLI